MTRKKEIYRRKGKYRGEREIYERKKNQIKGSILKEKKLIRVLQSKNVTSSLSHFMLHHPILWYGTSERGAVVKFVKDR